MIDMGKEITVIGVGQMGTGIAQAALQAGYSVMLIDKNQEFLNKGFARLTENLGKAVEKGKITADDKTRLLANVRLAQNMDGIGKSDFVIEAVPEIFDLKMEIFRNADEFCGSGAILATNTSSILINKLAAAVSDPSRFIGLHFFNPANVMKLVEVVVGTKTSQATLSASLGFISSLGKTPVKVNDAPGFISNRILMAFINEAISDLQKGIAEKESIDSIAKLGFNHPMGPIELADFIGLDVCKDIMDFIYLETKDEKFKPAQILVKLVQEGKLGRKSGEGFYKYK